MATLERAWDEMRRRRKAGAQSTVSAKPKDAAAQSGLGAVEVLAPHCSRTQMLCSMRAAAGMPGQRSETSMHEFLAQFGFDEREREQIVWAHHEGQGGDSTDRTDLLLALQGQLDGLDEIEEWVDEGIVEASYENLADLDHERAALRALVDKVCRLSDEQVADIDAYCLGFYGMGHA